MKAETIKQAPRVKVSSEQELQDDRSRQIPSVNPSDVTISNKNAPLQKFFRKKEEELQKKESQFSKILDSKEFQYLGNNENNFSKSISKFSRFSKSSARRKEEEQLRGVIEQHKKMLTKLQGKMRSEEELNEFEKNLLKEEKNRYLQKVEELEAQIQQLYRDNYRLKELERTKQPETFHVDNLDEKSRQHDYKPYVIETRNNDLNRINIKNYERSKDKNKEDILGSKLEKEKPISAQQFFSKKPNNFGLYEEKFPSKHQDHEEDFILKDLLGSSFDHHQKQLKPSPSHNNSRNHSRSFQADPGNASMESINRGGHFDTFQMANTLSYINDSAINESRQMVHMSTTASTRNKVAFFKNSLVLVRQPQLEIAFKRSDLDQSLTKLRIIFYANNKSSVKKAVSFHYDFQAEYFDIKVVEKLATVEARTQGREVIEVSLISTTDLNGVTDLHVMVDGKLYDFWLPALFIRFRQTDKYRLQNDEEEMTVLPDRQFANFSSMSEVAPLMFGGRDQGEQWAYLYGQSRFGSFAVKLSWRQKELVIEATPKWIDFLGFVLHFFK